MMHAQTMISGGNGFEPENVIFKETTWRRRPYALERAAVDDRVTLSRWTDPLTEPRRFSGGIEDAYHAVGIAMRPTRLNFTVGGRRTHSGSVAAGALQISSPGQSVCAEYSAASDVLRLYVPNKLLIKCFETANDRSAANDIVLSDPCFARDNTINTLAQGLLAAEGMGGPHGKLCAEGISLAIIARLLAAYSNCAPTPPRSRALQLAKWRLARVKDFVEAHLEGPIRLEDLAAAAGLSRMHFAAQFRAATGLRPHEFVMRRRIERAQDLLSKPDPALVDIALTVGFQTQAHFTTVFGRFVGETPLRWRQRNAQQG